MLQKGYMQVRLLHESSLSSSVVLCALYTRQRNSLAFAQPCTTTTCYIHTCLYTRYHASEFLASMDPQPEPPWTGNIMLGCCSFPALRCFVRTEHHQGHDLHGCRIHVDKMTQAPEPGCPEVCGLAVRLKPSAHSDAVTAKTACSRLWLSVPVYSCINYIMAGAACYDVHTASYVSICGSRSGHV